MLFLKFRVHPESDSCTTDNPCKATLADRTLKIITGTDYGFYRIRLFADSQLDSVVLRSEIKEITFINSNLNFSGINIIFYALKISDSSR